MTGQDRRHRGTQSRPQCCCRRLHLQPKGLHTPSCAVPITHASHTSTHTRCTYTHRHRHTQRAACWVACTSTAPARGSWHVAVGGQVALASRRSLIMDSHLRRPWPPLPPSPPCRPSPRSRVHPCPALLVLDASLDSLPRSPSILVEIHPIIPLAAAALRLLELERADWT